MRTQSPSWTRSTSPRSIGSNEKPSRSRSRRFGINGSTGSIGSIGTAIGLNEKFELINQLFGGSKEKFERTLEVLDMAGSFVEAYNYIEEQFEWDMDDVYVQRILELIRRKLIVRRNEQ